MKGGGHEGLMAGQAALDVVCPALFYWEGVWLGSSDAQDQRSGQGNLMSDALTWLCSAPRREGLELNLGMCGCVDLSTNVFSYLILFFILRPTANCPL